MVHNDDGEEHTTVVMNKNYTYNKHSIYARYTVSSISCQHQIKLVFVSAVVLVFFCFLPYDVLL